MLDASDGQGVIDTLWERSEDQALLPAHMREGEPKEGRLPINPDSRRAFGRLYFNKRAILLLGRRTHGVFVKDISKSGAGFYAPMQLFPRDTAWLLLPGEKKVQIEVRRCRRIDARCYECGAVFTSGDNLQPRFLSEIAGDGI